MRVHDKTEQIPNFNRMVNLMDREEVWYEFDGDDSCEDCRGWDGVERRCDCGNRRVGWECYCAVECDDDCARL
jgi:hypothetical protein